MEVTMKKEAKTKTEGVKESETGEGSKKNLGD